MPLLARWHVHPRWLYAIWLALFAILLNATAPTLSRLNAARQSGFESALSICSVDTNRASELTQRSRSQGLLKLLDDACPLCALHLGPGLLPAIWQAPVSHFQAIRQICPVSSASTPARHLILPPPRGPPMQVDFLRFALPETIRA